MEISVDHSELDWEASDGRYDRDEPYFAGIWKMAAVEPGSDVYQVTIAKSFFDSATDDGESEAQYYWHGFRLLEEGSCEPIAGSDAQDCFQETEERNFYVRQASEFGANEPGNNRRRGATRLDDVHFTQGFLEKRTDRDWYRFRIGSRRNPDRLIPFKLDFSNFGCNENCTGNVPRGENGDMVVRLFRAGSRKLIVRQRVRVGEDVVVRATLRQETGYRLVVRHAKSRLRPARALEYFFWPNNGNGLF